MTRYLVFGAHPDDETIGLGGTIAKLSQQGHEVFVVTLASGSEGFDKVELKERIVDIRRNELKRVHEFLGVKGYEIWGYEDYDDRLHQKTTVKRMIAAIRKYKPDVVFTHYYEDRMRDHVDVSSATIQAWWQAGECVVADLGAPWKARELCYYEIFDPLLRPSYIVDITDTFDKKIQAMHLYESQIATLPYVLQAMEGLSTFRGSFIGAKYGEAFLKSNFVPQAWP